MVPGPGVGTNHLVCSLFFGFNFLYFSPKNFVHAYIIYCNNVCARVSSLFGFIVLHMHMYSANIYFWRRYSVNYTFIFGFKQGTELGYREVFLLSSVLAVLALVGVISNLEMEMDERTRNFGAITELVPLGLLAVNFTAQSLQKSFSHKQNSPAGYEPLILSLMQVLVFVILCPFNIIYRSSRFIPIQSAFHCLCAPLYKV